MHATTSERLILSSVAQNLLRILIASYFLACGIGLIPGSDLSPLFSRVLPASLAGPIGAGLVFVLSYLVMIGIWLRGAALTLGILTFWASYMRMLDMGVVDELGGFWRDLALIAALMLTYTETDPRNHRKRSLLRHKEARRKVEPEREPDSVPITGFAYERSAKDTDQTGSPVVRHAHLRRPVTAEELESIFQTEFETVRSI